jgi:hypothetical protein
METPLFLGGYPLFYRMFFNIDPLFPEQEDFYSTIVSFILMRLLDTCVAFILIWFRSLFFDFFALELE